MAREICRRGLLGGLAAMAAAGARAQPIEIPPPPPKVTPDDAAYQDHPRGIYNCGMCSFFEPPAGCKVVLGDVSVEGWCNLFALLD